MKKNVFAYEGKQGDLVDIFYKLLITGNVVSYEDVLKEYDGGVLSVSKISIHELYQILKKVIPDVVNAFRECGYSVLSLPIGRTTSYQYVGSEKDPLGNIRFKALLKERYEDMSTCIQNHTPVRVDYVPFNKKKKEIIFHPHLLYQFNGRYFVFGVSEMEGKELFRRFTIALDRIEGKILRSRSSYIPPAQNEYNFLAHLVGVRLEKGAELITIRLRAHDSYTFGRIKTKPLHNSQRVVESTTQVEICGGGDVEIEVYPNAELVGQILSYGNLLEVISPKSFRERVKGEVKMIFNRYKSID